MKISACMIAKNEERCIARCLESYAGIADEIIVVDTGSSDNTVEIARSHGATVYPFTWVDDFSAAKNAVLEKASGDWILFLDADEYFTPGSAKALAALLAGLQGRQDIDGVKIRQYELAGGELGEYYTSLRAFRGKAGISYRGAIHEYPVKNNEPLRAAMAPPETVTILHDGYAGSLNAEKNRRNLALLTRMLEQGDPDPYLHYYAGQTLLPLFRYREALAHFNAYLDADAGQSNVAMGALLGAEKALAMQAAALPAEERQAMLGKLAAEAQRRYPLHPTAWLIAGNCAWAMRDEKIALASYQKAMELKKQFSSAAEPSRNLREEHYPTAHLRMARMLRHAGEQAQALAHCEQALNLDASLAPAYGEYALCSAHLAPEAAAKSLLPHFLKSNNQPAALGAVWQQRCDLLFLFLYDAYSRQNARKDLYFTTMQILVGKAENAMDELRAELTGHPLWQGDYLALLEQLSPPAGQELLWKTAEVAAAALKEAQPELLRQLLAVAPPALAAALRLALGEEVSVIPAEGARLLPMVAARLAAHGAGDEIQGLWRQVQAFSGQETTGQ